MFVPQGMAYALLAGMPPIYGLYGGLVPMVIYAILGSSTRLSIGPVAISALLILAGVSQLAEPLSAQYIHLVILAGLLVGGLQLIMSFFRLGFLVNFLSKPVIYGFTSAAAVIIVLSQLKDLLGIQIPRSSELKETLSYAWDHLAETNLPTLFLGLGGIVLILGLKRIAKRIPSALAAMILGIFIVWIFNLSDKGVQIVGAVPKGLPGFSWPFGEWAEVLSLMPTVLAVCLIGIVESISIAKYLESKHRDHTIRPNQELFALGFSKFAGSFFNAIPTSASFTRSAVNDESGARSQLSGLVTAGMIGLTLLFLTPLFYYLPKAILAAVILVAVRKLIHWKEAIHFWKVYRSDFFMMLATFLVTLILGIEEGVLAGVVLSIILMVYRSSRPHVAVLGNIPETTQYRNVSRFPGTIQREKILIIRFDAPLFFGNASFFKDAILRRMKNREKVELILLDASSIYDLDATGIEVLLEVIQSVRKNNRFFYISGVLGPARDRLYKAGLMEEIGAENQFLNIHAAVNYFLEGKNNQRLIDAARQTNAES